MSKDYCQTCKNKGALDSECCVCKRDFDGIKSPSKYSPKEKICERCGKELDIHNFFIYKYNHNKDTHFKRDSAEYDVWCKKCRLLGINHNSIKDRELFCYEFEIPYLHEEFQKIEDREYEKFKEHLAKKEPASFSTLGIFSKYYALMRLKGYYNYSFEDSMELNIRKIEKENNQMENKSIDNVNHPSHYCQEGSMECIDEMLMLFGREEVMHFCKLNAWKYRKRALYKNKEEDMKKSDWYLAKYKELKESASTACTSSIRCSSWS